MRRGVNARLTSRRSAVCSGGSVVSIIGSGLPASSVMPKREQIGVGVVQRGDDVVVARKRPEPEVVVVVAGRLVAQLPVDREAGRRGTRSCTG